MGDEALTAGAVARRLGVAVTTLRTWHQRYGLGPSEHAPGHHRRYTAEDLARLEVMRRLTAEGVAPAEAARWARRTAVAPASTDSPLLTGPLAEHRQGPPAATDRGPDAAAQTPSPAQPSRSERPGLEPPPADAPAVEPALQPPQPGASRHGGGNAIPVGRAGPAARGLARAAMRLDGEAIRDILHRSVTTTGVVATWDDVIVPVLIGVGERHAATRRLVEVEHLTSRGISEVLGAVPRPRDDAASAPGVLLACADEEQHSLALEALAAALAEAGTGCRLLGARVPPHALADAVARTGPAAVVVWSQLPSTADPAQLTVLLTGPSRPLLVVAAGPGWQRASLPAEVAVPAGLRDAVSMLGSAVKAARSG